MNVTICDFMSTYLPRQFGTLVERLDIKKVMADALKMASELPRRRRKGQYVASSDVRKRSGILTSGRMRVFAVHGCKCCKCGIEGTEVLHTMDAGGGHHIDLFAVKDGVYRLMNRDHILPASLGGPNHLWNLRPMCAHCNSERGNTYTDEDKKLFVHRLRWAQWGNRLFRWTPWLSDRAIYRLSDLLA